MSNKTPMKTGKKKNATANSAFEAFLDRNIIYFEGYASAAQNSNYYLNNGIDDATIEKNSKRGC